MTLVGLAVVLRLALPSGAEGNRAGGPNAAAGIDDDGLLALERISEACVRVSEVVKPSVVHIKAISLNKAMNRELQRILRDDDLPPTPTTGTGSGIIIDSDGHIVTNHHVVTGARKIYVTLADGRNFTARVVGADPKTDLAVLQINADRLLPARFGNSDALKAGQIVLAIGSPFRLGHSVTHGMISAIGRNEDSIDVDIAYKNWIQTDAPINPGNSGGPLINTRGEVIGVTVAIATESGGHQGVGFAIPSNTVARISQMLRSGETIVRGYLGVQIKPVDDRVADAYGLGQPLGAFIAGVGEETPAAKGGLHAEDIVLAVEGKQVRNQADLQERIASLAPGSRVAMTIWRNRAQSELNVQVGAQPENFSTRPSLRRTRQDPHIPRPTDEDDEEYSSGRFGDMGFEAETVTPAIAEEQKLEPASQKGVLITRVDPTSEAYEAGLRAGYVIVRANDRPVNDVSDLQEVITQEAVSKGVRLKYRQGGEDDYLVLRIR
jgi:serine protease Do